MTLCNEFFLRLLLLLCSSPGLMKLILTLQLARMILSLTGLRCYSILIYSISTT